MTKFLIVRRMTEPEEEQFHLRAGKPWIIVEDPKEGTKGYFNGAIIAGLDDVSCFQVTLS